LALKPKNIVSKTKSGVNEWYIPWK